MGEMLSVKNINVFYGSIHAIRDVSFHVNEGEIVTLIGANGAGKTTTMHAISGSSCRAEKLTIAVKPSAKWKRIKSSALGLRRFRKAAGYSAV